MSELNQEVINGLEKIAVVLVEEFADSVDEFFWGEEDKKLNVTGILDSLKSGHRCNLNLKDPCSAHGFFPLQLFITSKRVPTEGGGGLRLTTSNLNSHFLLSMNPAEASFLILGSAWKL